MPAENGPYQPASYEYYDVGVSTSRRESVTLAQLALGVEADWMPGLPPAFDDALASILSGILIRERVRGADAWMVEGSIAGCDRQWKGVASWLVGLAFCRWVVTSHLGYRWCAHVSAFPEYCTQAGTSLQRSARLPQGWPSPYDPSTNDCTIRRRDDKVMLPDYVLLRTNAQTQSSGYDLSFAESKGTAQDEQGTLRRASSQWHKQKANAEFLLGQQAITPTQEVLVVTRVCPADDAPQCREVIVRAWNRHHPDAAVGFDVARRVLFAHYYGVCRRIGLTYNAELLARAAPFLTNDAGQDESLSERARQELAAATLEGGHPLALARGRLVELGEWKVRLALAEPATEVVRWLQDGGDPAGERLVRLFGDGMESVRRAVSGAPSVLVREDGVVAFPEGHPK